MSMLVHQKRHKKKSKNPSQPQSTIGIPQTPLFGSPTGFQQQPNLFFNQNMQYPNQWYPQFPQQQIFFNQDMPHTTSSPPPPPQNLPTQTKYNSFHLMDTDSDEVFGSQIAETQPEQIAETRTPQKSKKKGSKKGKQPIGISQTGVKLEWTEEEEIALTQVSGAVVGITTPDAIKMGMDFPGGRVAFTSEMRFIPESSEKRVQCYRVLDDNGYPLSSTQFQHHVNKKVAVNMYSGMVTLQIMDTILYEAQRQGRISFYLTAFGEEAINIASAAALSSNDLILPQYREQGVLLWRGFTIQEFVNQCFGNKNDYGKGRQMPIHYGSKKHNYITVSSPIATQLPQAVGVAYSLKMDKKDACVVTYFGDGSTSEGDFHASLNFAAVMEAPIVFLCRNNGWAISTPITQQFRSDGVVVKGQAYGIRSIRVDGNDALAIYNAVRVAREMAIKEQKPILIEALTYRVSHHSTSDDSTKYRPVDEIEHWKTARSPVSIFRKWVQRNGWWSDKEEAEFRAHIRKQVMHAIQVAEKTEKPPLGCMFSDVYEEIPLNLMEQEKSVRETVKRHPQDFPKDVPLFP